MDQEMGLNWLPYKRGGEWAEVGNFARRSLNFLSQFI